MDIVLSKRSQTPQSTSYTIPQFLNILLAYRVLYIDSCRFPIVQDNVVTGDEEAVSVSNPCYKYGERGEIILHVRQIKKQVGRTEYPTPNYQSVQVLTLDFPTYFINLKESNICIHTKCFYSAIKWKKWLIVKPHILM
jgi:hypothetical protein